jgi:alkaline phosphatase D
LKLAASALLLAVACVSGPPPGITHGVATGDVTDQSAIVWARADGPAELVVEIDDGREFRAENASAFDFTAQVTLEGLSPGTAYKYRAHFENASGVPSSEVEGSFRTAPAPRDRVDAVRFIVGGDLGGHGYCREMNGGYRIFDAMDALSPDFFIANGDMIYADELCPAEGPEGRQNVPGGFPRVSAAEIDWTDRAGLQESFWKHWRYHRGDAIYQAFLARVPMYAQWDDHEVINDFGASWSSWPYASEREGFPKLVEAGRNAVFHYNPIGRSPEEPQRIYRSFRWGRALELFLLDGRSYRDRNDLADSEAEPKTLLGAEQLEWLAKGLLASDATWKVVSSDVPLSVPTGTEAARFGRDGWSNGTADDFSVTSGFEQELLGLLLRLDAADLENLVFVVTDVHCALSIRYDLDADGDGDRFVFHEFISGPLAAGRLPEPPGLDPTLGPTLLYGEANFFNFGYYRVERDADGNVHFLADIRDETGAVRPGSVVTLTPHD